MTLISYQRIPNPPLEEKYPKSKVSEITRQLKKLTVLDKVVYWWVMGNRIQVTGMLVKDTCKCTDSFPLQSKKMV